MSRAAEAGAGRKLLVVDDDRSMVSTLADVLGLHGWDADVAHSGHEAVEAVRERAYTVVLMDIKMPGMSGVDALKEIRALRPGARVVLMTAYSASELIEEAEREGVLDVLHKPVALARLLTLLEAAAMAPRPVLVVDDDPDFLQGLCDGLGQHGVETRAAAGLDEALRLLEGETIPVVLLDLRLDGLEGRESVAAIRELRPEVLVVLFSGYPEALSRTEATLPEGWVVGSFRKPFDPAELIRLLERFDVA